MNQPTITDRNKFNSLNNQDVNKRNVRIFKSLTRDTPNKKV